jgi:signal transduction histidine kinase
MRTLLLFALLELSFGMTALSLVVVRFTLDRQIQRDLASDLQHSVLTFENLQRQRSEMLARESALLADLPSLKALMTTQDARTIQDGGTDFWQISGMDLFQLYDQSGTLVASYGAHTASSSLSGLPVPSVIELILQRPQETRILSVNGGLYEVIAEPLSFGSRTNGSLLGYVVLGSAIDQHVAFEVSQASAAEVAFTIDNQVAVTTLAPVLQPMLNESPVLRELGPGSVAHVTLKQEEYLATVTSLSAPENKASGQVRLVVLRSFADARHLRGSINRWLLGVGALALVLGTIIAVSISRRVTRPLEALVDGARALGQGNFSYRLSEGGTTEIRELTQAFDHMRLEVERSQQALIGTERLATIGRMASSISHDLRHYISAIYANAEFLSLESTPQQEREELIFEVQSAVHGMTDLLDSLLLFSQTGKTLMPSYESIPYLIERAAALARAHPEGRSLELQLCLLPEVEAWVDATKFLRAIFNLLLNACQAANRGSLPAKVIVSLTEDHRCIVARIQDNGPGIPTSLLETIFEPFVSRGRENGTGLGLTLAQHIAQEHGGSVVLEESAPGKTIFSFSLNKDSLRALRTGQASVESQRAPDAQPKE